ncbi:hypothetical protein SAMN06264855_12437, partial [Halorubrum vacuolatum]
MTANTPADENRHEESAEEQSMELLPDGGATKTVGGGISIRGANIKDAELTRSELIL